MRWLDGIHDGLDGLILGEFQKMVTDRRPVVLQFMGVARESDLTGDSTELTDSLATAKSLWHGSQNQAAPL